MLPKPSTLMLVDDNRFDQIIVSRTIKHSGLFGNILIFSSGGRALKHLRENINNPDQLPQLILLDIQMPEMNGFEFIDEFAALPESLRDRLRIFMLSSTDDPTDIAKAEASPHIISLIKKPLHPDLLLQLMKDHYEME